MNITEVLQFADTLIFDETGQHLDDIQQAVIKGVWEGKTYEKIGEESNRSEGRVRDVGYKLWQLLSEQLGEDVNKANFRSTVERLRTNSPQIINVRSHQTFNFCSLNNNPQPLPLSLSNTNDHKLSKNLTLAPKVTQFYGRESELLNLSQWIENHSINIISVLGSRGIGKTTLVKQFIDTTSLDFDFLIWKDLKISTTFDEFISDILELDSSNDNYKLTGDKFTYCLELFQEKRYLIILDNVQELFISKELTGQYKPEYQEYKTFFQMIASLTHQSCLIMISSEKCQEMISFDEQLYPIKWLELEGLEAAATNILTQQGCTNQQQNLSLVHLYKGNPYYLQSITTLIKDVFSGRVEDFLAEDSLILTSEIKTLLDAVWEKLTEEEKAIIQQLYQVSQAMSREQLKQRLALPSSSLIQGLQSLSRRYLLQVIPEENIMYKLDSVFREYLDSIVIN
jgi:hypothetical protein